MSQKIRTTEKFTSGIVNVPLDPKLRDSRYTFFELDTKSIAQLREVWQCYMDNLEAVYIHETMMGYHFYNLTPINKEKYGKILRRIKHLNPECPMTTLRIIPNKWEHELELWKKGIIIGYPNLALSRFKEYLTTGANHMIINNYQVVRYPLE
jgi:hypothetical protein